MNQSEDSEQRARIAITMGDAAGIGPELIARHWSSPRLHEISTPVVIGSSAVLRREAARVDHSLEVVEIGSLDEAEPTPQRVPCLDPSGVAVELLEPGRMHARAGRAAYEYLVAAIDHAIADRVDAIVTLPINKAGLHAAGVSHPGHTEILAERTGSRDVAMLLYRRGLGVLHTTLHRSLRSVFEHLTVDRILTTARLLDAILRRLEPRQPRLAVAALNPHASDDGLFGDEERRIIRPAVEQACAEGIDAHGPIPADTLFVRAAQREFDGVVAMYHDQGHIALKLLGWREAVNVTVGLPIIRTSVAHGTAYDIVGRDEADPTSLAEAIDVAVRLARAESRR